jgi:hypothetical protein
MHMHGSVACIRVHTLVYTPQCLHRHSTYPPPLCRNRQATGAVVSGVQSVSDPKALEFRA